MARSGRNSRFLIKLERKTEKQVRRVLDKQKKSILNNIKGLPFEKSLENDIDKKIILDDKDYSFLIENNTVAYKYGGRKISNDFKFIEGFDLTNRFAINYAKNIAGKEIKNINNTTREHVRNIVLDAVKTGKSYTEATKLISTFMDSPHRPKLIATNEIGNAYLTGNKNIADSAAKILNKKQEKQWLTAGDNRVTDGCRANGAKGWVKEDYLFGTEQVEQPTRFPGCRCDLLRRLK